MNPPARVTVIIPARGGSVGIADKNLRTVGGVPLVARAVLAAGASCADRVVVTTDSDRIAAVAGEHGATVVRRPDELSSSTASSESALLHALDTLAAQGVPDPEVCVLVQCTSPFVSAEDIDGTVAPVVGGEADCAFTAVVDHGFLWRRDPSGAAVAVNHDAAHRLRRQDAEPQYLETGAAYAMTTSGFRHAGHRFFGRIALHLTDASRALEIDEPWQLELARAHATAQDPGSGGLAGRLPDPPSALVLDFDGVLTDNRVLTFEDGREAVLCDRGDGLGIERLRATGLPVVVLSKERNPVVAARCAKLGIEVVHGLDDKRAALVAWLDAHDLDATRVVFVGNDLNDLESMAHVGCAVAVADAFPPVLAAADVVLRRPGGRGAVRELIDALLERDGS